MNVSTGLPKKTNPRPRQEGGAHPSDTRCAVRRMHLDWVSEMSNSRRYPVACLQVREQEMCEMGDESCLSIINSSLCMYSIRDGRRLTGSSCCSICTAIRNRVVRVVPARASLVFTPHAQSPYRWHLSSHIYVFQSSQNSPALNKHAGRHDRSRECVAQTDEEGRRVMLRRRQW